MSDGNGLGSMGYAEVSEWDFCSYGEERKNG